MIGGGLLRAGSGPRRNTAYASFRSERVCSRRATVRDRSPLTFDADTESLFPIVLYEDPSMRAIV